jgi:hypothetical protein
MSSLDFSYEYQFFGKETALNDVVFETSQASRVKQCHSADVITIDKPLSEYEWPECDAIITKKPQLSIGVITADCAPILLSGDGVIAAVHAGWQGALKGVIDNTIQAMTCEAEGVTAMIGPSISKNSYEVSKGFEKPFIDLHHEAHVFFQEKNEEKLLFDLKSYCAFRLKLCGVHQIDVSDIDTLTNPDYHSHRGGAGAKDRNLSVIMING